MDRRGLQLSNGRPVIMKRVVAANWPRTRQTQSKEEMEGYRCSTINRIRYVEEVQKCGDEDHREGERERVNDREGGIRWQDETLSFFSFFE